MTVDSAARPMLLKDICHEHDEHEVVLPGHVGEDATTRSVHVRIVGVRIVDLDVVDE